MVTGECKDAFAQVLNSGFPGGLLSVDQTVQAMNKACYKRLERARRASVSWRKIRRGRTSTRGAPGSPFFSRF